MSRWLRLRPAPGRAQSEPKAEQAAPAAADAPARSRWRRAGAHAPWLLALLAVVLLVGRPMFAFQQMSGHDSVDYPPRQIEFVENLKAGELIPQWAPDFNFGYGEPFFLFNPPAAYYLTALFHLLGFALVPAANLALFTVLLLAGLGMYLLVAGDFGPRGALAAAIAYVCSPYMLVQLFVRHAMPDFTAFAWLPFCALGLLRYAREARGGFLAVGAAGMALVMLSSNPVSLMSFPLWGLLALWAGWRHGRLALLRGLAVILLGLALSAFFWLPAFRERDLVHTERLMEGAIRYDLHFVEPGQLVSSPWGYGFSWPGPNDEFSFEIGAVQLGALVLAALAFPLLYRRRPQLALLAGAALLGAGYAILLATPVSRPLWDRIAQLQYLQFPWRFLSIIAFATAPLAGLPVALLERRRVAALGATLALGLALLALNLQHAQPRTHVPWEEIPTTPEQIAREGISVSLVQEFQPDWVEVPPARMPEAPATVLTGAARLERYERGPARQRLWLDVAESARLELNTFFFPGWRVEDSGTPLPTQVTERGTMTVELPPGPHQLELRFERTPSRRAALWLSLAALAGLVGYLVLPRRFKFQVSSSHEVHLGSARRDS